MAQFDMFTDTEGGCSHGDLHGHDTDGSVFVFTTLGSGDVCKKMATAYK